MKEVLYYVVDRKRKNLRTYMQRPLLLFFLLSAFAAAKSQQLNLNTLLKIYNCNSLNEAYKHFSSIPGFKGIIKFDTIRKDSVITGTVNKDTIFVKLFKGEVQVKLTTHNKELFHTIKEQTTKKLYHNGSYARAGGGIARQHYVYSNKSDMNVGDLWFILTECRRYRNGVYYGNQKFYEIILQTYDEDKTAF